MKYQLKPVVVEAFQMTKETGRDNRDWPEWLHEAWNKGRRDAGAFFRMPAGSDDLYLVEKNKSQPIHVAPGDWIIRHADGSLSHCKRSVFEETYEPAE